MSENTSLLPDTGLTLSRRDLISFEDILREEIASYLSFTSYSLFFPRSVDGAGTWADLREGRAVILPEEGKALLPLALHGQLLGVFAARGVEVDPTPSLPTYLAAMAWKSMEKLLLYKAAMTDPLTGLATAPHFLRVVSGDIAGAQDGLMSPAGDCLAAPGTEGASSFGLVHIALPSMPEWQDRYGYTFGDRALCSAAAALRDLLPEQAVAARLDGDALGVFWPGATPVDCRELADHIASGLQTVAVPDIMLGMEMALDATVGLTHYPTDMPARTLRQSVREQAGAVLAKAARAAGYATHGAAFSFGQIVQEGGTVTEILPLNRITVSLGRTVGAAEGQRYLVWSDDHGGGPDTPPMYKGEIVLMEVRATTSTADVLYLADTSWTITPGDRLSLAQQSEEAPASGARGDAPRRDLLTGLLLYRDFLDHFAQERDACDSFSMVLVRLPDAGENDTPVQTEMHLRDVSAICSDLFGDSAVGGRFSIGSLIWFLPGCTGDDATDLCAAVQRRLEPVLTTPPAFGIAPFPHLGFSRADALDNARKALAYAQMLPAPRIGVLDSVALNISADRLFAQGRIYDAIEEYQLSLLADEGNTVARNSLGICLARTGQLSKAKQHFQTVIDRDSGNLFARYNHAFACQKMAQYDNARAAYNDCLAIDPDHVFSLIRLGELAQRDGDFDAARGYYTRAAAISGGEKLTHRFLARLALAQKNPDEAREHLHQAILHDPKDAVSLHLMAKLYLDNGEDPHIAEVLARQSAALAPRQPQFWKELARALTAQGKAEDAHNALVRAESV